MLKYIILATTGNFDNIVLIIWAEDVAWMFTEIAFFLRQACDKLARLFVKLDELS